MPPPLPALPDGARDALAKAALLEDPFPLQALIASGAAPDALDPLFDLGLLEEAEPGYACFADEAIRLAARATLSWSQKRRSSQVLAEAGESLGLSAAVVGRLFLQAQLHAEARRRFARAAEEACQRHDHRAALELIRTALEIWPATEEADQRQRALREMARCANACSDHASSRQALTELIAMTDPLAEAATHVELQRQLAQTATAQGERHYARELLQSAATLATEAGLAGQSAALWRSLAQAQGDALRLREALQSLESARAAATACEDWALLSDGLAYAALLTAMLGRIGDANTLLDQSLSLALERDLPDQIANAYRRQANINEYAANYEAYRDKELAALDRCRTLGDGGGSRACLTCVSYAFYRLGQYDESLDALTEALADPALEGELEAGAVSIRACILAVRGMGADVEGAFEMAQRLIRQHGAYVFDFYVLAAWGGRATLLNETAHAREAFDELIAFWRETDDRKDVCSGLVYAASFFAQENALPRLSLCIDILNTIQSDSESAEPRVAFLAASGESAWSRGATDDAIACLRRASEGYGNLNLPFEQAWTLWRLGYVLSQSGQSSDGAEAWRAAEAIAQRLGMRPLARAISRDRSQAAAGGDADLLTPRQLDIARLISSGLSNKEAAAELGISPRTVEMHVAALLERLGCRSRAEAARKLSELGLLR